MNVSDESTTKTASQPESSPAAQRKWRVPDPIAKLANDTPPAHPMGLPWATVSTHPNGVHLDVGNARINGGSLDVGNVFEDTTQQVEDPLIAMIPENIVENHNIYLNIKYTYIIYIHIYISESYD